MLLKKAIAAKHQYINDHYYYAYKVGIIPDGLDIVKYTFFFNKAFIKKFLEVNIPNTDNPDIDKETGDSTAFKPVLSDFFYAHSDLKFSTFLADSVCDSYDNYSMLKNDFNLERACIPLNRRNSKSSYSDFNEFGNPVCPLPASNLPFSANPAESTARCVTNGYVKNPFRLEVQENVFTPIQTRASVSA